MISTFSLPPLGLPQASTPGCFAWCRRSFLSVSARCFWCRGSALKPAAGGGPVSNWVEGQFGGFAAHWLGAQFLLGLLLGAVWSPCVGPTLGAASILAARGENLGEVALTMVAFGIGAAVPLIAIGLLSREALSRWRGRLMEAGKGAKSCSAEYWLQSASWWRQASTRGWRRFWLMLRLAGSRVSPPSSERLAIATASHF